MMMMMMMMMTMMMMIMMMMMVFCLNIYTHLAHPFVYYRYRDKPLRDSFPRRYKEGR